MDVRLRILTCTSVGEFSRACRDPMRENTEIPVLNNAQAWPISSLYGTGLQIERSNPSHACAGYVVLSADTTSALPAMVLAAALGAQLQVVPLANLHAQAREALRKQPLMLVALREEATDALLFGLLDDFQAALESTQQWETLPQLTLVTARDLAALSWLVAKIIVQASKPANAKTRAVFASLATQPHGVVVKQMEHNESGVHHATREMDIEAALGVLTRPFDALAYSTHGEDACASAGGGAVLCGLHAARRPSSVSGVGTLACGLGHGCLRGPKQIRLSTLPTPLLMLHACNSLRLADSSLDPDFNLGLEFLDGLGSAYVGTLYTGAGALSASAFMAALASGATLSNATNFANAVLVQSRMDRSMFIAIGAVHYTATSKALDLNPYISANAPGVPIKVAGTSRHVLSVRMTHPEVLIFAKARALSLSARGTFWFYRVEGPAVRIFLFRFPQPLEEDFEVTAVDGESVRTTCLEAVTALERWIEVWRLARLTQAHRTAFEALTMLQQESREFLAAHLERLRFDGLASTLLAEHRNAVLAAAANAARTVLDHFAPQLSGSFWLTNIMAAEYRFECSERVPCVYCSGFIIRKRMKHSVHGGQRVTDVCPRCGIVADLQGDGPIVNLTIEAPEEVSAGTWLVGAVKIDLKPNTDVMLRARLCTHGQREIAPLDETNAFRFLIPAELPPHQYRIKVLAATGVSLNFASRLVFVK